MIKKKKIALFCIYVIPTLAIFTIFVVIPFIRTFYISLTDWNGYGNKMNFIGLENFKTLLQDELIWDAFKHNIYLFITGFIITFSLALIFAVSLTRSKMREKNFYRIIFYFPNILSIVIVSVVWMFIYNPTIGLLNGFLKAIGLQNLTHAWLGELDTVLVALAIPWIWMSVGFYMILMIAAIENIPASLYESATIDGANEWQQVGKITIPLIWDVLRISIVFFILNAFSGTFTIVDITTKGGPARASDLLTTLMYENAFTNSKFGYGTAIGTFIFIILLVLSLVWLKLSKRDTIEY